MAHQIESWEAIAVLEGIFALAEDDYREQAPWHLPEGATPVIARLFASETQAYREALVGCAVAKILNPQIDIRYPATEHDPNSFSGP